MDTGALEAPSMKRPFAASPIGILAAAALSLGLGLASAGCAHSGATAAGGYGGAPAAFDDCYDDAYGPYAYAYAWTPHSIRTAYAYSGGPCGVWGWSPGAFFQAPLPQRAAVVRAPIRPRPRVIVRPDSFARSEGSVTSSPARSPADSGSTVSLSSPHASVSPATPSAPPVSTGSPQPPAQKPN